MLLRTPCLLTAASRRSDLEILSYCMVQWLCGRLPWEDKLQDPLYVRDAKIRYVKLSTQPGCSSQQHFAIYTILQYVLFFTFLFCVVQFTQIDVY